MIPHFRGLTELYARLDSEPSTEPVVYRLTNFVPDHQITHSIRASLVDILTWFSPPVLGNNGLFDFSRLTSSSLRCISLEIAEYDEED